MNGNIKIIAIVQARQDSTRFPDKVLKKIKKKNIIEIIFSRLKKSKYLSKIVYAIPKKDKILKENLINKKINFYSGSEDNVLQRYYQCALKFKANVIVRITADCPFVDSIILDNMIKLFLKKKPDYLSNINPPNFPDGLDIEIFNFNSLKKSYEKKKLDKKYTEHVTFYMTENPHIFNILNYSSKKYLNFSNIRLTLDNEFDLNLIKKIFKYFKYNYLVSYNKIYNLIKNKPEFFLENKHYPRNYGMKNYKNKYTFNNASKIIPGGNQMISKNPLSILPYQWPMYYKKAKGCKIWTIEDKKYYDFSLMGVGANLLGYANSKVDNFVKKKINLGSMSTLNCFEEYDLAEELIKINPWAEMVRFAKTGGEINSIAIRIARSATGKSGVAFCGYHGWHDWYLSANLSNRKNLNTHLMNGFFTSGVPKSLKDTSFPFEFNNIQSLKKILSNNQNIGTIKMEIYRNLAPKKSFLREIRSICNKKNIVLIFDECTSGFRSNYGGIYQKYNIEPDIALFGKALGNGYPITACVGRKNIMEAINKSFVSSTFWSERVGFSAALATLKEMKRIKSWNIVEKAGLSLKKGLENLSKNNNIKLEISGLPALTNFKIIDKNSELFHAYITQEMLKKGFLSTNSFYSSISHNRKNIDSYLNCMNKIFEVISKNKGNKNFANLIEGPLPIKPFSRMN